MRINLFSKRQKQPAEVLFVYDKIPIQFRNQVVHIWRTAIGMYHFTQDYLGTPHPSPSNNIWNLIHDQLCREYGIFELHQDGNTPFEKCVYFIQKASTDKVLDIIEFSFACIDSAIRKWNPGIIQAAGVTQYVDDAIEELNQRFREHALGYQYQNGRIIRIDSEYIHEQAVKPAIQLLTDHGFSGASEEFLKAHEHFRHGRYKEAVNDALNSMESTLKTICKRMGWDYSETDTASKLLTICFSKGLVAPMLQNHLTALRTTLESGLPTVRNKRSGHGQGELPSELPPHLAAYALHLAGTNIVFLVESYHELNK